MGQFEHMMGLSRNAVAALPLLLLPMLIGAMLLIAMPGHASGTAAIVFSTIAVAWYLLGGAISLAHGWRGYALRRALTGLRREVALAAEPVWICDGDGLILFQNDAAEGFGDLSVGKE